MPSSRVRSHPFRLERTRLGKHSAPFSIILNHFTRSVITSYTLRSFTVARHWGTARPMTTAEGKALEALISNFMVYVIDNHGFTHPHLKGIPESIARLFGKDVLPSIKALGADGLTRREIASELEIATYKTRSLLEECELQHQRLRGGIKDEYEAIKSGYSELYALLEDAEQIIESPLQALEWNKARVPRP